jgi:SWI/SNF-related matrix-associated actin-dependent regulator 1 of chromatin subfamily A
MAMYVATSTAKVEAVCGYVKELCESGEKFIVFANHLAMIRALQSTVEKKEVGYMLIVGETPAEERREGVHRFQNDELCKVAILSLQAASQGITLTAASTVVFAELHWTPGLIEQVRRAFFDRNLHARMPLVPTPLLRLMRACV